MLQYTTHDSKRINSAQVEPKFIVLKKKGKEKCFISLKSAGNVRTVRACGILRGTNLWHFAPFSLSYSYFLHFAFFLHFLILSLFVFLSSAPLPPTDLHGFVVMQTIALCHHVGAICWWCKFQGYFTPLDACQRVFKYMKYMQLGQCSGTKLRMLDNAHMLCSGSEGLQHCKNPILMQSSNKLATPFPTYVYLQTCKTFNSSFVF